MGPSSRTLDDIITKPVPSQLNESSVFDVIKRPQVPWQDYQPILGWFFEIVIMRVKFQMRLKYLFQRKMIVSKISKEAFQGLVSRCVEYWVFDTFRIVCNNENVKFQGLRTGLQTTLRLSIPFPWLSPMLPLIVCLFSCVKTKNVFSNLWQSIVRKHAKNIHMWRIQSQIYFYCVSWFEKTHNKI